MRLTVMAREKLINISFESFFDRQCSAATAPINPPQRRLLVNEADTFQSAVGGSRNTKRVYYCLAGIFLGGITTVFMQTINKWTSGCGRQFLCSKMPCLYVKHQTDFVRWLVCRCLHRFDVLPISILWLCHSTTFSTFLFCWLKINSTPMKTF